MRTFSLHEFRRWQPLIYGAGLIATL